MPLVSQTYAGQFLNASELTPLGQRRSAIVHSVALETIGQGSDAKSVLVVDLVTAAGKAWPKRVVLNKTNSTQLAAAYGDDTDGWTGKAVEVWAENVMFQGRMVPGLKLMPGPSRPAQAPLAPPITYAMPQKPNPQNNPLIDDEIPF